MPKNFRPLILVMTAVLGLAGAATLRAGAIAVPNGSFEGPVVPLASPYATSVIDSWQKAPVPSWWTGAGYTELQWDQSTGVFLNVGNTVDNIVGNQGAFIFAAPGMELYQELPAVYEVGQSYKLSVLAEGGGYGMALGVPIEFRFYYLDGSSQRVTISSVTATNANGSGGISHLTEYSADLPIITGLEPWAGKKIGIQLISTVGGAEAGGYWDVDNVQVVSVPEPATLGLLAIGAVGLLLRRRRL